MKWVEEKRRPREDLKNKRGGLSWVFEGDGGAIPAKRSWQWPRVGLPGKGPPGWQGGGLGTARPLGQGQ